MVFETLRHLDTIKQKAAISVSLPVFIMSPVCVSTAGAQLQSAHIHIVNEPVRRQSGQLPSSLQTT